MLYYLIKPHTFFLSLLIYGMIINKNAPKRNRFSVRLAVCVLFFAVANTQIWHLYPTELGIDTGVWFDTVLILYFLLLFSEAFFSYLFIFRISATGALFSVAVSYALVDIMNSLRSIVYLFDFADCLKRNPFFVVGYSVIEIIFGGLCLFFLFRKYDLWDQPTDLRTKTFFATMITLVGLVVARFADYIPASVMKTLTCSTYCVLCDSFLLFSSFVTLDRKKQENRVKDLSEILNMQYLSSQLDEETIQELNRFAHDWKNSSLVCGAEKTITVYENRIQTGNGTLDIVINEKNKLCQQHGISLRVMVDGNKIDDMAALDLAALFGNALDNAIEGCLKIERQETRFIAVRSSENAGFRCFVVENSSRGKVDIGEDGLIQSDKLDSFLHGLGISSMQRICSRYGGTLKLYSFENLFRVVFILPEGESSKAEE